MGRGTSAYLFKIDSKLSGKDLKKKIEEVISANQIQESSPKKQQKGFVNINLPDENSPKEIPKLYFMESQDGRLTCRYRYYEEKIDRFAEEIIYNPKDTRILYDSKKRILICLTPYQYDASRVLKIFLGSGDGFTFKAPSYRGNEEFLRWLIDNEKSGRDKFPKPCKLMNIVKTKVIDLEDSTSHPTTESVYVQTTEHLSDDLIYREIEEEGVRDSIGCQFEHSKWVFELKIYRSGKVTLGSQPPNIEAKEFIGLFPIIFEELENLYKAFLDDTRGA